MASLSWAPQTERVNAVSIIHRRDSFVAKNDLRRSDDGEPSKQDDHGKPRSRSPTGDRGRLPRTKGTEKKERENRIYFSLPILKIALPQEAQVPFIAGRPFFSLICLGFLISRFFFFS